MLQFTDPQKLSNKKGPMRVAIISLKMRNRINFGTDGGRVLGEGQGWEEHRSDQVEGRLEVETIGREK